MSDHDPSRRTFLRTGAGTLAAALVAGCLGGDSGGGGTDTAAPTRTETRTPTETEAGTEAETETQAETASSTEGSASYTVEMAPVGEITFESVPETWVANNGGWADMGIALGQDPPEGVWLTSRYHTQYYDSITGLSVDKSEMVSLSQSGSVSKELFYDLGGEVHVIDPNFLMNRFDNWEQSDVDEIAKNVGPFFGNTIFSTDYGWHSDYRYYTLMEAFEKLAEVFQERERYKAFASVHKDFQQRLAPVVPGQGERPSVAVAWGSGDQPEQFYPYTIGSGTSFKHLRDLKVNDAFANSDVKDFHSSRGAIDYETLLEVDPEVLLVRGQESKTAEQFRQTVVGSMENHEVASSLTAVENGEVYRAGGLYQGPITNLVLTERLATDLYGTEEDLFDRQRVADIVSGDF